VITIYTKDLCGFCHMAMKYLKENEIEFKELNIDYNSEARVFLKENGHTTCPQIYNSGNLLVEGGCDGLLALSKKEILERMNGPDLGKYANISL